MIGLPLTRYQLLSTLSFFLFLILLFHITLCHSLVIRFSSLICIISHLLHFNGTSEALNARMGWFKTLMESQLKQQTYQARVMMNIVQLDEMPLRFVDGLGFDQNGDEHLNLKEQAGVRPTTTARLR
ncbi:hypothetical protein BDF20DRAFT_837555 [Mycotypha africana]|uniref:uncharacterized protein n=1 Tax=Mycotypha africana TaxID=64632 RepID=UPI00230112FC|nr:uncharacterized protein BDF20DRAFT_837555 [Mycotypha africana]KAI8973628.1 hypothetical protein BDF20DRAFT_837555 [Mycotypha africana]